MKSNLSLQRHLNGILILVALVFFLAAAGVTGVVQYKKKMTGYAGLMKNQAEIISQLIDAHLSYETQRVTDIILELEKSDVPQTLEILGHKLYPTLHSSIAYVLDTNGHVILVNPDLQQFIGFDLAHMPFRQMEHTTSNSFQSVFTNHTVIAQLYPLPDQMLLVIERDALTILSELKIFTREFQLHNVSLYLMDQKGLATYHPDPAVVRSRHNLAFEMRAQGRDRYGLDHISYQNQLYYGFLQEIGNPAGWHVILLTSAAELKADLVKSVLQQLGVMLLLCLLIALTLSFFLNRCFSRPVKNIVTALGEYQGEESRTIIPATVPGAIAEFQQIATAINEMASHVHSSHQQLQVILDSIDSLIYVADMETCELLFVNDYGRQIWGDVQGKICWQVLQRGQSGPCPFCTNDRLLDQEGRSTGLYAWEFQNTVTKAWFACRDQAIPWDTGRLVRMEIATDITAQKTIRRELLDSQEWLHSILQTAPVGIGMVVDRVFRLVNKQVLEITGYSEEELLGRKSRMLYPSDEEFEKVGRDKYKKISEDGIGAVETRFKRKDGVIRDVLLTSSPLDCNDLSKGVLFTVLDITKRKETDEALKRQHALTEELVQERTRELVIKNRELERLNKYYVAREFRVKELKRMVERLKKGEKGETA